MNTSNRAAAPGRLAVGVLLFVLGILVFKSIRLSLDVSGSFGLVLRYLVLDASFLGLLVIGAVGHAHLTRPLLRFAGLLLLLLVALFYAVHSFVLLELDEYMSLVDLGRYLPEWHVVESFLGPVSLIVVVLLMFAAMLHAPIGRRARQALLTGSVLLLGGGLVASFKAPADIGRYALIPVNQLAETLIESRPVSVYAPAQAAHFSQFGPGPAEIPPTQPDIIVLIIESLSSINSYRSSGVNNLLPTFDRLSEKGVLFNNFLANHAASEGGIIALMSGFPPLHYPTATPLMFDEFASQPAVVHDYRDAGYFVEFLTNADLAFIGLNRYLEGLGIDLARGRDQVPEFESAPRFVQDAPSDRYLYAEALRRAGQRREHEEPWLLVMATTSTHLPYTHPEGGEDSAEAVWQWSLARLEEFVQGLEQENFFDHGALLITGDHRQMRALSEAETGRYGESARARVPLLAIGPGWPAGHIDERLFQQADLLRYLDRISRSRQVLSTHPVWVERYNRIYGRVESINRFQVFEQQADGLVAYPVRVLGTQLQWPNGRPQSFRAIEAGIHAQRSAHQVARNGDAPACQQGLADGVMAPTREQGLSLWRMGATEINELSSPAGSPDFVTALGGDPETRLDSEQGLEWYLAFLNIEQTGTYWFRSTQGSRVCMSVNGQLVLDQLGQAQMQAPVELERGRHLLDIRFAAGTANARNGLQWIEPGLTRWRWREVPESRFIPAVPP